MQRHANVADPYAVPFQDSLPSIPCAGVPGPLGVAFTTYYLPAAGERRNRYGIGGGSFMGVYEFGEQVRAATILQFGQSPDPNSPHYFDQAQLYSQQRYKPAWYHWDDVLAHSVRHYHPGEDGSD